jgi:NADH dehydrogenase [ubiquinone] 1 alpha subcomplex assembly factor 7
MTLHAVPKAVFNGSVKLARTPVDATIGVLGGSDSRVKHLVDRAEAGARSAVGTLFADEELREEGRSARLATKERERALRLHEEAEVRRREGEQTLAQAGEESQETVAEARRQAEQERRKAEKRKREREARARKAAEKEKEKTAKAAAKVKRVEEKADKAARLRKIEAKEESIEAKEKAVAKERQAERVQETAAAAKAARKNGN